MATFTWVSSEYQRAVLRAQNPNRRYQEEMFAVLVGNAQFVAGNTGDYKE
jgi:hypothetical protein